MSIVVIFATDFLIPRYPKPGLQRWSCFGRGIASVSPRIRHRSPISKVFDKTGEQDVQQNSQYLILMLNFFGYNFGLKSTFIESKKDEPYHDQTLTLKNFGPHNVDFVEGETNK